MQLGLLNPFCFEQDTKLFSFNIILEHSSRIRLIQVLIGLNYDY